MALAQCDGHTHKLSSIRHGIVPRGKVNSSWCPIQTARSRPSHAGIWPMAATRALSDDVLPSIRHHCPRCMTLMLLACRLRVRAVVRVAPRLAFAAELGLGARCRWC
eukprot:1897415-Pleurochrysis_carterae.AAC.1